MRPTYTRETPRLKAGKDLEKSPLVSNNWHNRRNCFSLNRFLLNTDNLNGLESEWQKLANFLNWQLATLARSR